MRLVEDDDALISVALVLVVAVREPGHDLVEARRLALPRGGAQRGIGGEQDALRMGDVGPLAHLAEGDDVLFAPADGAPVAARVLQQLVGLREPEGALPAPQPLVETMAENLAGTGRDFSSSHGSSSRPMQYAST